MQEKEIKKNDLTNLLPLCIFPRLVAAQHLKKKGTKENIEKSSGSNILRV